MKILAWIGSGRKKICLYYDVGSREYRSTGWGGGSRADMRRILRSKLAGINFIVVNFSDAKLLDESSANSRLLEFLLSLTDEAEIRDVETFDGQENKEMGESLAASHRGGIASSISISIFAEGSFYTGIEEARDSLS